MKQKEHIEIPLSKTKMTLTLLGSLAFVGIGIWFLIKPPKISNPILGNPTLIIAVGLASILFFGFVAVSIFRKLSSKNVGLIISRQGVTDNSSGVSAGLIPWTDIQEINVSQVMSQKFLLLIVRNPQEYLDNVRNPIKRTAMKANYKMYGSPISISAKVLDTDFDRLHQLMVEKLKEYKA
ncbi:MAG: STM3941 family protein [Fluviicola sp.]|nr:STM3941 family protein [Fluviicola sp.]